jgi:outer membrane translocation and assembly module TamA
VVASGGAEWRRWRTPVLRALRIAPAAFVDVARAYDAPAFADARAHVDAGLGVRVAIAGAGVIRADVARGLRDGQMAVSVGWSR